jgi:ABC-type branched-subunit amino acid transport system ATPase component
VPLVRSRLSRAESTSRVTEILELTGLSKLRTATVAALPDGQKKLLEVARAIMIPPRLLILDEPFAGVSADVVELVITLIRKLTSAGTGCLAISHDIASMPRLCEEVLVLVEGKVLTRGPLASVRKDPRVVEAYLGA